MINLSVEFVNRQGLYRGAAQELRQQLPQKLAHASTVTLAKELVDFVGSQTKKAKPGERFPGSTETPQSAPKTPNSRIVSPRVQPVRQRSMTDRDNALILIHGFSPR